MDTVGQSCQKNTTTHERPFGCCGHVIFSQMKLSNDFQLVKEELSNTNVKVITDADTGFLKPGFQVWQFLQVYEPLQDRKTRDFGTNDESSATWKDDLPNSILAPDLNNVLVHLQVDQSLF